MRVCGEFQGIGLQGASLVVAASRSQHVSGKPLSIADCCESKHLPSHLSCMSNMLVSC
jgi:hypothetical protein